MAADDKGQGNDAALAFARPGTFRPTDVLRLGIGDTGGYETAFHGLVIFLLGH